VRTATKNQLLGQVDRAFPGLGGCLSSLLDTKVGRLVLDEFADPVRLARLGPSRFRAVAARRGLIVQAKVAQRLVAAARQLLPTDQALGARRVLTDDLALLAELDTQIGAVERRLAVLLPQTPFQVLATVPGWATVRVASYAAAVGDLAVGRRPVRCTGRPGSPRQSTSRPAAAETAASPGRARWRCAGRCLGSVWACGVATRPRGPTRPPCGPAASTAA
jgi:hypothetical protein